jgi:CheY-like chemotaxis protein
MIPDATIDAARRVLVVDDEPVVCDVLSRLLKGEGFEVDAVMNAEDAIAHLKKRRYALLVSDKNLPRMSGLQLLTLARQEQPFIEAVLITGYPSAEALLWAFAAGASEFLIKPFPDLAVVRAKLKAAVERFSRRALGGNDRSVAKEAAEFLMAAPLTPKPALETLQHALQRYELAVSAPDGRVAIDSGGNLAEFLKSSGMALADNATDADVVLVPSTATDWRDRVRALKSAAQPPTVVLVAEASVRLDELLEALEMKVEVAPSPQADPNALMDRVRALLGQKGVERAQAELVKTLETVRRAAA